MGFLLTPSSFLGSIILSLILGVHRFAINPLLSLLALLWVCCGPFSLFYITYYPWVCHFSLSPGSLRPICLFYGPAIHYSYRLGLMFFSIHLLTLFYPCCWASSFYWASQNDHQQPQELNKYQSVQQDQTSLKAMANA